MALEFGEVPDQSCQSVSVRFALDRIAVIADRGDLAAIQHRQDPVRQRGKVHFVHIHAREIQLVGFKALFVEHGNGFFRLHHRDQRSDFDVKHGVSPLRYRHFSARSLASSSPMAARSVSHASSCST